jgi:hypothetical protein
VAPPTRQDALATLRDGHDRLASLLDRLSGEELRRPGTIGGGDWSAIDLVDHLALWEQLALQSLSEWREGRRPMIEDVFGQEGAVDRLNDANVGRNRQHAPAIVRAEADSTHLTLVEAVQSMSDEEWTSKAPYPTQRRDRLASLLGSVLGAPKRPFGHAFAHLPDLEAYVESRG